MKNRQTLLRNLIFFFIVAVQIAVCIHYANYKDNLFLDEIWTFNLANSYYNPFIGSVSEYMNRWIDSNFWLQSLCVQNGEEFSYGSVFYNQSKDVHPPLYYIVIHTICSFFPKQFSIWFGIIPNIVFFGGTQIILLKIADKLFDDKWSAIIVGILYGFSWGAVNSVVYIRMYMMLTFWWVLSFWMHLLLFEYYNKYKKLKIIYLLAIFVITICGFLTQYYYVIFAFFLSLIFCIWLLKSKEIKLFVKYAVSVIGGFIASIMIFPAFLNQMFNGYQGEIAIQNLSQVDLWMRLKAFVNMLNMDVFGKMLSVILISYILYNIIQLIKLIKKVSVSKVDNKYIINISVNKVVKLGKNYNIELTVENIEFLAITCFTLCIFLLIAKIAPYLDSRYIFGLYPFICLLLLKFFYIWLNKRKFVLYLVLIFVMISCFKTYDADNLKFSYTWKNTKKVEEIINIDDSINSIFVFGYDNWNQAIPQMLLLSKTQKSLFIDENDYEQLKELLCEYIKKNNKIIVYISHDVKNDRHVLRKISDLSLYKNFKEVDSNSGKTYLFFN